MAVIDIVGSNVIKFGRVAVPTERKWPTECHFVCPRGTGIRVQFAAKAYETGFLSDENYS